jgi:hypothetical protein
MHYHDKSESFDDPLPDREHEERASRRIVFALLVAGAVIASLYGLGALEASLYECNLGGDKSGTLGHHSVRQRPNPDRSHLQRRLLISSSRSL